MTIQLTPRTLCKTGYTPQFDGLLSRQHDSTIYDNDLLHCEGWMATKLARWVSEWVEFNASLDTIQVISEAEKVLSRLIIMCWAPWWKPNTSWTSKPSTIEFEVRTRLEIIRNELPQKDVARAVKNFRMPLQACVDKTGGHFEHLNNNNFYYKRAPGRTVRLHHLNNVIARSHGCCPRNHRALVVLTANA